MLVNLRFGGQVLGAGLCGCWARVARAQRVTGAGFGEFARVLGAERVYRGLRLYNWVLYMRCSAPHERRMRAKTSGAL